MPCGYVSMARFYLISCQPSIHFFVKSWLIQFDKIGVKLLRVQLVETSLTENGKCAQPGHTGKT